MCETFNTSSVAVGVVGCLVSFGYGLGSWLIALVGRLKGEAGAPNWPRIVLSLFAFGGLWVGALAFVGFSIVTVIGMWIGVYWGDWGTMPSNTH